MAAIFSPLVGIRRRRPSSPRAFGASGGGGGAATAYTLTPSTMTGLVGSASSSFTVTSNGLLGSPVTVTPSDGGKLGTFSPTTATLGAGTATSATFTYTPLYYGTIAISTTNDGGLSNPSAATFTSTLPSGAGLLPGFRSPFLRG